MVRGELSGVAPYLARGARAFLEPPIEDIETFWSGPEKIHAQRMLACAFTGSPQSLRLQLNEFLAETGATN